jgi:hypothetical protein
MIPLRKLHLTSQWLERLQPTPVSLQSSCNMSSNYMLLDTMLSKQERMQTSISALGLTNDSRQ